MVESRYIWLNGDIVPVEGAKISVLSPTAQFGANVFEGIRCYWNDTQKQLLAFRLDAHYDRLERSVKMFRMNCKYSREDWRKGFEEVIKANNYQEDIAVRQTIFIDGDAGSWFSTGPVGMFIAPIPKKRKSTPLSEGISCCVSSWERISERCLSPKVKVGANYINSRLAQLEATANGYDSAIFLGRDGSVSEGPGSCFFMIRDSTLITPPLSASILESITRATLLSLARNHLNVRVEERPVDRTELYICDEAFLCGSAVELTPIFSIDDYTVGNRNPGSLTTALHRAYLSAAEGKIAEFAHWTTPVACSSVY